MRHSIILLISVLFAMQTVSGQDTSCNQTVLGKVWFKKNSYKLNNPAKNTLDSMVAIIQNRPNCTVAVSGSMADFCDKCGVLSWDRQKSVISYLMEKGVEEKRMSFFTELTGNTNYLTFTFSSDPPINNTIGHPGLRKRKKGE